MKRKTHFFFTPPERGDNHCFSFSPFSPFSSVSLERQHSFAAASKNAPCPTSRRSLASLAVRISFALPREEQQQQREKESFQSDGSDFDGGGGTRSFSRSSFFFYFSTSTASSLFLGPIFSPPGLARDSDRGARALKLFIALAQEE